MSDLPGANRHARLRSCLNRTDGSASQCFGLRTVGRTRVVVAGYSFDRTHRVTSRLLASLAAGEAIT